MLTQDYDQNNRFFEIACCRICGNKNLSPVIDLGIQTLTGVFPQSAQQTITAGPLELVRCAAGSESEVCGLVQLKHSYDSSEMYGDNYGYRSGLNSSMVTHLGQTVEMLLQIASIRQGEVIVDIGSNDGTLLSFYPKGEADLVGIDPTSEKFKTYYREDITILSSFFSEKTYREHYGEKQAKIVTSIAMFYDLQDPVAFAREVSNILADDGIWHFEQSYLVSMMAANAYDTICHEHLEYYALRQIEWICREAGLRLIDVQINNVNGGSFAVTVCHDRASYPVNEDSISHVKSNEREAKLEESSTYQIFSTSVQEHKVALVSLLKKLKSENKKVLGYGASTKGNVILQYCGITREDLPAIADVNEYKYGRVTPGTHIPIISETQAHALHPDILLVLPWHFRQNLISREQKFLDSGGKLLFPLPEIEMVNS